jgi:hypothetical protein
MSPQRNWIKFLPWITGFAVAMAFLESAVVVYLRELYYPVEFRFPMAPITRHIAITELVRELATLVMLLAPGALITPRRLERFAWFIYCFGVWDIFYYVFLKAVLDWPATLLDWDILFLVPVVWVGPVLAPCVVSVGLIAIGLLVLRARGHDPGFTLHGREWGLLISAGGIILYTFLEEPMDHILGAAASEGPFTLPEAGHEALAGLRDYVPEHYNWALFTLACAIAVVVLHWLMRRGSAVVVASK